MNHVRSRQQPPAPLCDVMRDFDSCVVSFGPPVTGICLNAHLENAAENEAAIGRARARGAAKCHFLVSVQ